MTDAPAWIESAVKKAGRKLHARMIRAGNLVTQDEAHRHACAAIAAFLREMPDKMLVHRLSDDEHGTMIGDDGLTTHNLAGAVERVGRG